MQKAQLNIISSKDSLKKLVDDYRGQSIYVIIKYLDLLIVVGTGDNLTTQCLSANLNAQLYNIFNLKAMSCHLAIIIITPHW